MSLLEEWNSEISGTGLGEASGTQGGLGGPPGSAGAPAPLFGLEHRAEFLSRGRGHAVAFAVCNDSLFVATSRNFVLRHDVSGVTGAVAELEVTKAPDTRIRRLFVDPLGLHALLTLHTGGQLETLYLDTALKKARPVAKLRGVAVTSVAWSPIARARSISEALVGTDSGVLLELSIDESKKERVRQVYDLNDESGPIAGLLQIALSPERRLVLALCGTRLHAFAGGATLEALFASYAAGIGAAEPRYVELPIEMGAAQLQTLYPARLPDPALLEPASAGAFAMPQPEAFAVLSPAGIYYGRLDLDPSIGDETDHLVRRHLLPAAVLQQGSPERPLSLALTQHHFVLLYPSKLQFVNRTSKAVVQEVALERFAAPLQGAATMPLGLCRDHVAGHIYVLAGDDALEVDTTNEERDMWQVYLDKGDYRAAMLHCRSARQRNAVYLAEADALLEEGQHVQAAQLYGKVTSTEPSFEEIALRLMDAGEPEAVHAFLATRLETLGNEDRAQATMIATWLTELYLDQVNRALLQRSEEEGERRYEQLVSELRDFLQRQVDTLDVNTTISLLAGYGRMEELMHYARCRQDHEAVLEYLLQRGEAERALEVLRKPSVSPELVYKFAPALMALSPAAAVRAWMEASPPLDPRRLLPALLQFGEPEAVPTGQAEALRYVRFCIHRLGSEDPAVHNLAVELLAAVGASGEEALLDYLAGARDPLGRPLYDPVHALRLARERGCLRASVQLFCEVGMYGDAVALALSFDRQLAVAIARRPEGDEALSRKLWLAIARHIVEQPAAGGQDTTAAQGERVHEVSALLEESRGALRIEDVLPLFPDFVEIDAFKDAVCSSLEKYNQEIAELKHEMQVATTTAQAIRENLAHLELREALLDTAEPCARCDRPLHQPPPSSAGPSGGCMPKLYLFPTGNAFHGSCLCAEVCDLAPAVQRRRIQRLAERLAAAPEGSAEVPAAADVPAAAVEELRRQLEQEVAVEDPYCGEIVARHISKPFILPEESAAVDSWAL